MVAPFDIFQNLPDGLRWIEASPDLETAKERVRVIGASSPGTYIIFSQKTGNKISIDVDSEGLLTVRRNFLESFPT